MVHQYVLHLAFNHHRYHHHHPHPRHLLHHPHPTTTSSITPSSDHLHVEDRACRIFAEGHHHADGRNGLQILAQGVSRVLQILTQGVSRGARCSVTSRHQGQAPLDIPREVMG